MIEVILEELKRRDILIQLIDSVIKTRYAFQSKKRLKRGSVQEEILAQLGIRRNNMLCALINERMRSHGYETIINHGDQYFRNIIHRSAK